jgi:hypothetical protein
LIWTSESFKEAVLFNLFSLASRTVVSLHVCSIETLVDSKLSNEVDLQIFSHARHKGYKALLQDTKVMKHCCKTQKLWSTASHQTIQIPSDFPANHPDSFPHQFLLPWLFNSDLPYPTLLSILYPQTVFINNKQFRIVSNEFHFKRSINYEREKKTTMPLKHRTQEVRSGNNDNIGIKASRKV